MGTSTEVLTYLPYEKTTVPKKEAARTAKWKSFAEKFKSLETFK